jgi:hypothetical protein
MTCEIHPDGVGSPCHLCARAWAVTDQDIATRYLGDPKTSARGKLAKKHSERTKLSARTSAQIAAGRGVQPRAKSMPPAIESFRQKRTG